MTKNRRGVLVTTVVFLQIWIFSGVAVAQAPATRAAKLGDILQYISQGWNTLTRSTTECSSVADPKLTTKPVIYLPADLPTPASITALQKQCAVEIEHLPKVIHSPGEIDVLSIHPQGLLFLEKPYVVPGGRFNEMYGWDSYFIIVGLLRDGRIDLARDMVENFFFEIEHYGTVLNANRTYYLTRSQPPFLTSMALGIFNAEKSQGKQDMKLLERTYQYAAKDYQMWTREPHLAGSTGLSRYYDFGEGPAPEVVHGDPQYYRKVAGYFVLHPEEAAGHIAPRNPQTAGANPERDPSYFVQVCFENQSNGTKVGDAKSDVVNPSDRKDNGDCVPLQTVGFTPEFYKGDRAMRESGFDPSFRFGPYDGDTHYYAPVCLNSLMYKWEKDLEQISSLLGKEADSRQWQERAENRRQAMQKYLWDEQRGTFTDYNFRTGKRSTYDYVTAYYPLWAGWATPEQARAQERHLGTFERAGGLAMSPVETGVQWDYPYGWAPNQLVAIQGLRRYGFAADANRLSQKFLSMVLENFRRDGTIREKYNVATRSSETHVQIGYETNVVGFGWTNGVFLELLHELPKDSVDRLGQQ